MKRKNRMTRPRDLLRRPRRPRVTMREVKRALSGAMTALERHNEILAQQYATANEVSEKVLMAWRACEQLRR